MRNDRVGKGTRRQLRTSLSFARATTTSLRKLRENLSVGPAELEAEADVLFGVARALAQDVARLCAKARRRNRLAAAAAAEAGNHA